MTTFGLIVLSICIGVIDKFVAFSLPIPLLVTLLISKKQKAQAFLLGLLSISTWR